MSKNISAGLRLSLPAAIELLEDLAAAMSHGAVEVCHDQRWLQLTLPPRVRLTVSARIDKKGVKQSLRIKVSWAKSEQGDWHKPATTGGTDSAEELRLAFREALCASDYERAIDVGESIVESRPDSLMAEQFRMVKRHLRRRVGSPP